MAGSSVPVTRLRTSFRSLVFPEPGSPAINPATEWPSANRPASSIRAASSSLRPINELTMTHSSHGFGQETRYFLSYAKKRGPRDSRGPLLDKLNLVERVWDQARRRDRTCVRLHPANRRPRD